MVNIPTKPHATEGQVSAKTDQDYLRVNMKAFDPYGVIYGGASQALWEQMMEFAQTNGISVKDMKTIETAELTAARIYPAVLLSVLQTTRAMQNIINLAPLFWINIASGAGGEVFSEDEYYGVLQSFANGKHLSIPGIEDFITRINPIWVYSEPYDLLNIPAGHYLHFTPNKTITELRALRVLLGTYHEDYQTFCNKVGIKTKTLDLAGFLRREVTVYHPYNYNDKDWLFWNGTGGLICITNGANDDANYLTARRYVAGEAFDAHATTANWVSAMDKYYIIPKDGDPSDLTAIMKIFFEYGTENLYGCVVPEANLNGAISAADVAGAKLCLADPGTTNDTAFAAFDRGEIGVLENCFPSIIGASEANATTTCSKLTGEAGEDTTFTAITKAGGLRILNVDSAIWDNTNALLAQSFMMEKWFGRGGIPRIDQPLKRYVKDKQIVDVKVK